MVANNHRYSIIKSSAGNTPPRQDKDMKKVKYLKVGDVFKFVDYAKVKAKAEAWCGDLNKIVKNEEYVVIRANMKGGSTGGGMNGHDDWPDGMHITAKALKKGLWNENGKKIKFYHDGCFTVMIDFKEVKVIGKMKMIFVPA